MPKIFSVSYDCWERDRNGDWDIVLHQDTFSSRASAEMFILRARAGEYRDVIPTGQFVINEVNVSKRDHDLEFEIG